MIRFVNVVKQGRKQVATAVIQYPEGFTTCIARAEDFLSQKTGVPRVQLRVQWLETVQGNKNFVFPAGIPVYNGIEVIE